jgi:hypothetical protein
VTAEAKIEQTRRTKRIFIALPVQVFGTEITGQDFFETTRTHLVSPHGAIIVLKRQLAPLQQVTIRNLGNGKEAAAQVIGPLGGRPEGNVYAFAVLHPRNNLWNVNFPAENEAENAVHRVAVECNACRQSELVSLDDLELAVFEANRKITRACARCGEPTVWHQALHGVAANPPAAGEQPQLNEHKPENGASGGRENRRHPRVRMKMTACVCQPGFGSEDMVAVEDISRGGLGFHSAKVYYTGSIIEVAAPYMPGAANVFVPARVVRFERGTGSDLPLYGVAYLKKRN